jgi:hypothetical protein
MSIRSPFASAYKVKPEPLELQALAIVPTTSTCQEMNGQIPSNQSTQTVPDPFWAEVQALTPCRLGTVPYATTAPNARETKRERARVYRYVVKGANHYVADNALCK